MTEPDPVVVLFAKWGNIQDETVALGDAPMKGADPLEKKRDELYDRQATIERQIIDTPATSVGGIAVKLRLLAYIEFPMKGLSDLYRTPAKDTDFDGFAKAYRADGCGPFEEDELLIGSLRDAEQLAGVLPIIAEPDPVVTLFAEWGTINEEVIAHLAAIPKGAGENMGKTGHVPGKPGVAPEEKDWDDALDRRDAVEKKILETLATSMRGVAIKIRLVTHCAESGNLTRFHATPAREIDYEKECISLEYDTKAAVSALLDAERLAGGVS